MGCTQSTATDAAGPKSISRPQDKTGQQSYNQQQQQPPHHKISVSSNAGNGPGGSHNGSIGYDNRAYPEVPPAVPEEDTADVYVARFAYQARTAEDLSFEKGEMLKVIELEIDRVVCLCVCMYM